MAKQSKPLMEATTKPAEAKAPDSFTENVEQALKHYRDPLWLGRYSPLASPYFLGGYWDKRADGNETQSRGAALQQVIQAATKALMASDTKWSELWGQLLHLTYFDKHDWSVQQIADKLVIAPPTYQRHRRDAVQQLAQEILTLIKPALRLETPALPTTLIGQDATLDTCVDWLRQGKSLALTGAGGIGKTTLGVALAHRFAPAATFWFTLQPGLNDNLHSILFALAYFLHNQGASGLWSQLVADRGEVKIPLSLNLLRHDLTTLSGRRLLLCFDEVDLLNPTEIQAHKQLEPFLESLRGLASLLLIGQKPFLETDYQHALSGLSLAEIATWLQQTQIRLTQAELQQLHQSTDGNPRLLELFIALYHALARSGQPVNEALVSLAEKPSVEFLLRRVWRHLNEDEMALLEVLAIFRNPVPRDAWSERTQQVALAQLQTWRLVQADQQSGVALLPIFKMALAQHLLAREAKEVLHLQAAIIRAKYGQYTAAAYHYVQAEEQQIALQLWYIHWEQEINQGQAETGLQLLQTISHRRLSKIDQETLILLRAELQKLLGHYDEAQKTLQTSAWRIPFLQAQAKRLEGDITELRGQARQALEAYRVGAETIEQWTGVSASMHRALGFLYFFQRDFEQAKREVFRIRHDAANLEAVILKEQGDLPAAQKAYEEAIQLAKEAHYLYGEANVRNHLGSVLGWQGKLNEAEHHLREAIQFFKLTNRVNKLASVTYNLAFVRRLSDQYQTALEPAKEALALFEQLGEEFGRAVAMEILAEIHLGLGDLEQAEQFAQRVLQEENTNTQPDGLRTLGEIRLKQGNFTEAERLISASLKLAQDNQDKVLEGYAWRALGEVYLAHADRQQAEESFNKAIAIFTESGMPAEVEKTAQISLPNSLSLDGPGER